MKIKIGDNNWTNSILMYIAFAFFIVVTFIFAGAFIGFFKFSDNINHIIYFISAFIPVLLIKYILKIENDPNIE